MLTLILKELAQNVRTLNGLAGSCGHGNEPSGSIEGGQFVDYLSGDLLVKKDSSSQS
jgi:hypothetical protein